MTNEEKKELYRGATILVLAIFIAICGFIAGKREGEKTAVTNKFKVDSLTNVVNVQTKAIDEATEWAKEEFVRRQEIIEKLEQVKKNILYGISKTKYKVFSMPDSAMQHYVDSVRAAGGFH